MSNFTSFIMGSIFGAFVAQNYDIPPVKEKIDEFLIYLDSIKKK